jgi:hypothetical protein
MEKRVMCGTPDWILQKKYLKDRSNDVVYQNYVKRYFAQIANQLKGLYYKDGGNIIGIQLENEYWYGKEGEPHIQWLKDTALENGIDVPMYTVTGWGDGSVPPFEVIPLWEDMQMLHGWNMWEKNTSRATSCSIRSVIMRIYVTIR